MIPLGLTAAAVSAADAGIHKTILDPGTYVSWMATLILTNQEMKDIMKII